MVWVGDGGSAARRSHPRALLGTPRRSRRGEGERLEREAEKFRRSRGLRSEKDMDADEEVDGDSEGSTESDDDSDDREGERALKVC